MFNFEAFQRGMKELSSVVQSVADGVKELKSAYRLVRVSEALCSRLALVFYTLVSIAFPSLNAKLKTQWPSQLSQIDESVLLLDEAATTDVGTIAERLQKLGQCVDVFNTTLKGLPGFHDVPGYNASGLDASLQNFAQDLNYWGRNLSNFRGQVHRHHILVHVATVPVATLFASVSASTIQLSYTQTDTRIDQAVNILWIVSLVFAIASAINSQLSYQWSSMIFMTPLSTLPWQRSLWTRRAPLIFLVLSVISLSSRTALRRDLVHCGVFVICERDEYRRLLGSFSMGFGEGWSSEWFSMSVKSWCSNYRVWFLLTFGENLGKLAQHRRRQRDLTTRNSILPMTFDIPIRRTAMETRGDNDQPPSNVGGDDAEAHAVTQLRLDIRTIQRSLELGDGPSNSTSPAQKFRSAVIKVIMERRRARAEAKRGMELALQFLSPTPSTREHNAMIHDINFSHDGRHCRSNSSW
ncbi:uncharacterized protein EI90DRAFT_2298254 [Cantharellus anzutake]|uniref:uncharacterized protein n=1 Tax=Cantharellus anzutake TaxID=1750568 RepID=UPI001905B113|nr:uncharacterized protein EI90DRAFT_2298254 [Cantharellus anzutake]KAF8339872.1 hypothetical protein EI90DRAFT_2298254 [Cantharellus anzutake]